MLMITIDRAAAIFTLRLDGRLAGANALELTRNWNAETLRAPHQPVLLDVSGVTSIDSAGRAFLERVHGDGCRLLGGDATRTIVDEITAVAR